MKNTGLKAAGLLLILAVVIGSVTDVFSSSTNLELHEQLLEENVELFEADPIPITCHSSGTVAVLKRYTDCSTCSPVIAYKGEDPGQCYPDGPVVG